MCVQRFIASYLKDDEKFQSGSQQTDRREPDIAFHRAMPLACLESCHATKCSDGLHCVSTPYD